MSQNLEISKYYIILKDKMGKVNNVRTIDSVLKSCIDDTTFNGILPKSCIYVKKVAKSSVIFLIEQYPQKKSVAIKNHSGFQKLHPDLESNFTRIKEMIEKNRSRKIIQLQLQFPYMYFMIHLYITDKERYDFADLNVCMTKKKIENLTDKIYLVPLPNLSLTGAACLNLRSIRSTKNPHKILDKILDEWWNQTFSWELYETVSKYYNEKLPLSNIYLWALMSGLEKNWIFNQEFIYMSTVKEFVNKYSHISDYSRFIQNELTSKETRCFNFKGIDNYEVERTFNPAENIVVAVVRNKITNKKFLVESFDGLSTFTMIKKF